ncbi:PIN domain-containing protein [Hydrogenophaga sp. 5NK40-0174]|uniref:PIN domain-containing protein n=1 Tax=Hydrogenophaga sp. 5NK40-0174 TaxID=3127649 RepID=UPI003109B2DF
MSAPVQGRCPVVIDTNIALDLLVFQDPATDSLRQALAMPDVAGPHPSVLSPWLATESMGVELERVLAYPQIARRLASQSMTAGAVMSQWRAMVQIAPDAAKAPYTCKDGDDQKFIDLAVAHQAVLLSKDAAVLCMTRRLAKVGATVMAVWPTP